MRVIARIPDVSLPVEAIVPATTRADPPRRPVPRPRHRDGIITRVVEATPTWPLVVLAAIALVAWMAAARNEYARLERQRNEIRLARKPAVVPAAPASDGAVIR